MTPSRTAKFAAAWLTIASAAFAAAPSQSVKLAIEQPAPDITATTLDGKPFTLATLKGKPAVIEFGSLTEPLFRTRVPAMEQLAAKYGDKVSFIILYAHESHPADGPDAIDENVSTGFAIARPTTPQERLDLAKQTADRLAIKNEKIAVDAWSNVTSLNYGNYPNMTFVLDDTGTLQAGYPWADPTKIKGAVDALVAGKPVPDQFRGHVQPGSVGNVDYADAASEMYSGGASRASLALVLDRLKLDDQQKAALYPAVASFLADARDFRELHGGGAPVNAAAAPTTQKAVDPDDFQKSLEKLRASAQHLKEVCKQNLSEKDAAAVLGSFQEGPAKRLFAD